MAAGVTAAAMIGLALSCVAPTAAVAFAAAPHGHPRPDPRTIGGHRLAGRGVIVSYRWRRHLRLPDVPASAWVIANANTGQVLAAKDPHGLFPPASTLKVLTAITMLPRLNPDATVLATRQAASVVPNIVGLIPGHRYKVADLFRALLLISANDAAVTLVQAAGSFGKGMALLNAEAQHLQAYDVVAKQPNGLPAPGQVVSAYDLALIAKQALAMPAFMHYDSTLSARFPVRKHKYVTLVNQNYLLTQYRGGIGGKIGWTMRAEATYIGLARRHGQTLIVTILHATPLTEITSAERLLDWGFAVQGRVRPVGVLVPPLPNQRQATAHPRHSLTLAGSLPRGRSSGPWAPVVAGLALGLIAAAWVLVARWRRPRHLP
jgi:D-alanyl-D-alanine carboxypeptidase (penicillin-binding protein 5/6)